MHRPEAWPTRQLYRIGYYEHHPFYTLQKAEGAKYEDVQNYPVCQTSVLSNGLMVATEQSPWNNLSTSVGVFVDAGSRYENDENNGTAHFLEHLAFKGTQKRTREALEREVEDMGGHLNAYTSREQTVYYAQVLKQDTKQAVDILSDIILNSTYDVSSIERERSVILQEMENVYKDTKEELIFDHLHENCFQDCSLGRTILGPVENIKRINREDILQYVNQYYRADRMVVVATGAVDHDEFVQMCAEKLSGIPQKQEALPVVPDKSYFRGCEYNERWDDMPFVHMAIAYETCAWNDPDTYPLMFMQQIMGQWDKKIPGGKYQPQWLTWKLNENDDQLGAENYMAFNTPYTDTGLFGIYGTMHPYAMKNFCMNARRMMNRLGSDVSDFEVEDVREKLKATMLMNLSNSPQVLEEVGRQLLVHGRRIHPTEAFTRIDDVDTNSIRICGQKYLTDRDHAIAAVGPTFEIPDYVMFRNFAYKIY